MRKFGPKCWFGTRSEHESPAQDRIGDKSAAKQPYSWWLFALLIGVMTLVVYLPAVRGGMLWDDEGHITKPELQPLDGLRRIWFELGATQQYYPVLHTAFWVEHRLWGSSVVGYHLVNIVLHAASAALVYLILIRLKIPGAALAAAIFAAHPVAVESVAWISEQKNTLSAVLYLAAMLAYLRFDETRNTKFHFAALALFTLGLLTKTVTATLPAALLVVFWWQRGKLSWNRDIWPLAPFFALGAVAGALTAWVERALIGAEGASFQLTIAERSLIAGRSIWFYLVKLCWPANLTFVYPRWKLDATAWWQWLFPLAALAATAAFWMLRKHFRGPLAAWLFFVGTLFPVLGFLNLYPFLFSFVADHFQYLASLGVIVFAAAAITQLVQALPHTAQRVGHFACAGMVVVLSVLTMFQSRIYGNVETLYKTTLARNPDCWMASNNLAAYLASQGRDDEAEPLLHRAIYLRPEYPEALMNLGAHYANMGHPDMAIDLYHRALIARPDFAQAEDNWGNALVLLKRPCEAILHYQRAIGIKPDLAMPRYNLGNTLRDSGDTAGAIARFREAIHLDPQFFEAHYNLGSLVSEAGNLNEGIEEFRTVLRLRPDYAPAHHSLGLALYRIGDKRAAMAECQAAIAVDREYLPAYADLARIYVDDGRRDAAVATAEKALAVARTDGRSYVASQIEAWLATLTPAADAKN
jgi:tetratricopeptide (TPR) repeat protein